MNILYTANARLPSEKAHPYQIIKTCEAFVENGIDLELILPFRVQRRVNIWKYYGIKERFKIKRLPSLDLIWINLLVSHPLPFFIQATSFAFFATIYALFRKADIYYTRDRYFAFLFCYLKSKKKIYYEAHQFEPIISMLAKKGRIDRLVVNTERLKERMAKQGVPREKIVYAPNGVDLKLFKNLSRSFARKKLLLPHKTIIGYVGQFHTVGVEKGINDLIRAFKIVKEKVDCILCLVGGPKKMIKEYSEFARREGLEEEDIIFVGQVPPHRVPLYLYSFDVCVMPFPWTEHYAYYMCPIKLFEYMASRRPIVASDLPAIRSFLNEEKAVLVKPGSPSALAEGIEKVLSDKELAKKIAEKAFSEVHKYSWSRRVKRVLEK
jgi:glycosyltransferase involved in cell wall biosynthesis